MAGTTDDDPSTPTPKAPTDRSNTVKDPSEWTTGDEPMTGAQASYLKTLCEETGEAFDATLTKAAASQRIDALQGRDDRLKGAAPDA